MFREREAVLDQGSIEVFHSTINNSGLLFGSLFGDAVVVGSN